MACGLNHYFVSGVHAETEVRYAVSGQTRSRFDDLHCAQAMTDSSCGLMCVLTAAMVLCGIPRSQVENIASAKRGPLRDLWTLARESYFEGADEREIARWVDAFSPALTSEIETRRSARHIGNGAAAAVQAGHVPIVRFDSRTFSHFAPVIGIESMPGEPLPRALLLLDPAASRPWGSFYNARLELQTKALSSVRASRTFTRPYRFVTGEAWAVKLTGMVIVKRSQPP